MNSAILTVAIIVSVILAAVIAVQRVKYKNLVQQTNQSMKDLHEKEDIMRVPLRVHFALCLCFVLLCK